MQSGAHFVVQPASLLAASVVLTPLGLETADRARKIIADMEDLASAARASSEPLSGTIRMGVISTVGPYLLPRVLPGLRRAYGQLKLYLVEDLTVRLIEALHVGKLDAVLLALPCDCGAVETSILFEDPFVVEFPKVMPSRTKPASHRNSFRPKSCCC